MRWISSPFLRVEQFHEVALRLVRHAHRFKVAPERALAAQANHQRADLAQEPDSFPICLVVLALEGRFDPALVYRQGVFGMLLFPLGGKSFKPRFVHSRARSWLRTESKFEFPIASQSGCRDRLNVLLCNTFFWSLAKMPTVNIRKQGGAAIMTIPADVLKKLAVGPGETLEIEVTGGVMLARPARTGARRRYSVAELLEGVTPAVAREIARESAAWHSGPSVGRELP